MGAENPRLEEKRARIERLRVRAWELRGEGLEWKQIAERLGVSARCAMQLAKKHTQHNQGSNDND